MRVRLDRVVAAVDGVDRAFSCARAFAHRRQVVGVARRAPLREREQRSRSPRPPRRRAAAAARRCNARQPGRTRQRRAPASRRCRISSRSCGTSPSASASSTTKVRLRSFDDCEIRCTRSRPNAPRCPDRRCSSERMPRPTRVIAAHGTMTLTRTDLGEVFRQFRQHVGADQVFGRIERDGDVGFRGTDQVHRQAVARNSSNTSARKPTCCHMPMLSIDTSTMPLRRLIAFTPGTGGDAGVDARARQFRVRYRGSPSARRRRGRARSNADAALWRRWWRFPALRHSRGGRAGARPAPRAGWR